MRKASGISGRLSCRLALILTFLLSLPAACSRSRQLTVAALGDSLTSGGYGSYLPALVRELGRRGVPAEVADFGRPGNNSREYLDFLESRDGLSELHFDLLVVMLGTNDVRIDGDSQTATQFSRDYGRIIGLLKRKHRHSRILLVTPPPLFRIDLATFGAESAGRLRNEIVPAIRAAARDRKVPLLDLHGLFAGKPFLFPGVHPGAKGYRLIGELIAEKIVAIL